MVSWRDLRREPFRLLFPLAIIFGCLGVGYWIVQALGWVSAPTTYHTSTQVAAYMYCWIAGFLLTALPRFASTSSAPTPELAIVLALLGAQQLCLWRKAWGLAELIFLGLLLALAVFAGRRFTGRKSQVGPPVEFIWILVGLLAGLLGGVLLMVGRMGLVPVWWVGVGRPLSQQGFLLAIVVGVAGFMAPRLMGREARLITPAGLTPQEAGRLRLSRARIHGLAAAGFLLSFFLEGLGAIRPAYLLRAGLVTAELAWTARFYRRPEEGSGLYVRLLWASLWMLVLGLWGAGIAPRYRVAMLHVTFLGGFSLMTFAVGTMVVLSHSGQAARLQRPLPILQVVSLAMGVSLIARLLADIQPDLAFQWYGVAAASWWIAGLSWLAFILPYVTRPVRIGEFERLHDAAKRQLLRGAV